ncbi:hypothetical protein HB364_04600 [Pseudoflavitalea sp. X16]|uniref:hypothetical protein n=1 Tax=Paraflavitalea devenefica TaxID=2716334 RepID=UPI00141EE671|nr:hypothetical protein [Paraflavitalea devenefica]NII24342.1 hypothetical protein [Paraflavitalea devenefica]
MKKHTLSLLLAICMMVFYSCSSGGGKAFETTEGMADITGQLDDEFGKDASYTSVILSYHKDIGTMVSATGTKDPASKKLIEKHRANKGWEDRSEITLEIEGDAKPSDFMFTLKDVDNLKKVPEMVKLSVDKIKKEKNFDVVVESVNVSAPSRINSPEDKLRYLINCAPPNGGTKFTMIFDNTGNFQKMLY